MPAGHEVQVCRTCSLTGILLWRCSRVRMSIMLARPGTGAVARISLQPAEVAQPPQASACWVVWEVDDDQFRLDGDQPLQVGRIEAQLAVLALAHIPVVDLAPARLGDLQADDRTSGWEATRPFQKVSDIQQAFAGYSLAIWRCGTVKSVLHLRSATISTETVFRPFNANPSHVPSKG